MKKQSKVLTGYLKSLWNLKYPHSEKTEAETEASWNEFTQKIFERKKSKAIKIKYLYYAAASILLFFVVKQLIPQSEDAYTIVENHGSSIKQVILPDSSLVSIQPNGKLYFVQNFTENRKVKLQGEAFFQVHKNASYPFRVSCNKTTTTVLGTTFNIKQLPEEVRVSLYTGSVKMTVEGVKNNWILSPGETFVNNTSGNSITPFNNTFNPIENYIDLENVSLAELIDYVDKIYGYQIIVDPKILMENITVRISKGDSLENLVQVIATIYKLKPEINEKTKQIKLTK